MNRREVLAAAGTLALARLAQADSIELPPLDAPDEKPKSPTQLPDAQKLGIAVVGIGHLTVEQILPAFGQSTSTKLAAVVSGHKDKADKVAAHFGAKVYDYAGFDRIKDDPTIDAVYIVLPDSMHADYVVRAAQAGKHVLCEKPMAPTVAECERMIAACKQAKTKLMVAYRMQYEPHARWAQRAVRDKKFGRIRLVEGHNGQNTGDPTQWRLKKAYGGGPLFDVGIYCLNTCRFLLGEEPIWVQAATLQPKDDKRFTEVEETCLFSMGFPSGALGNFSCSFGTHESRRFRALGDKGGWLAMDPAFPYSGLELTISDAQGVKKIDLPNKQQFTLELDHFAHCIRNNVEPYTGGDEGMQDVRIMTAIYEAAKSGKRVELPHVAKLDAFRGPPP